MGNQLGNLAGGWCALWSHCLCGTCFREEIEIEKGVAN